MKILKFTFVTIIAVFVMFFALAILLPSTSRVERQIIIHAPADSVYHFFSDLHRWNDLQIVNNEIPDIYNSSVIHFSFLNKKIKRVTEAKLEFLQGKDGTMITWTNETQLPLYMRMTNTKIEETTGPYMDERLAAVKHEFEK